jgi:hypothetical protein
MTGKTKLRWIDLATEIKDDPPYQLDQFME